MFQPESLMETRPEVLHRPMQDYPAANQAGAIAGVRARNGDGDTELAASMLAQQEPRS